MDELVRFKFLIKPIFTTGAILLIFWRPWTTVALYLFAFRLPNRILGGHTLLMFPEFTLWIPLLIRFFSDYFKVSYSWKTVQRFEKSALILSFLFLASAAWGHGFVDSTVLWGAMFLLCARSFSESTRVWYFVITIIATFSFLLALYFLRVGTEAMSGDVFDAMAYEVTGDRNYNCFTLGCGAVILWCLGFIWIPKQTLSIGHWGVLLRGMSFLGFLVITWSIILFQSRGLALALIAGIICSIFYHKQRLGQILWGTILAGVIFYFFLQTPAYELLFKRFQDATVGTAGGRVGIFEMIFTHYSTQNPILWIFGFGANAIYSTLMVSSHNTFITILIEQGIVGLGFLMSILLLCSLQAWKRTDSVGAMQLSLLVFLIIGAMSIEPHRNPIFWICIALAAPFPLPTCTEKNKRLSKL